MKVAAFTVNFRTIKWFVGMSYSTSVRILYIAKESMNRNFGPRVYVKIEERIAKVL